MRTFGCEKKRPPAPNRLKNYFHVITVSSVTHPTPSRTDEYPSSPSKKDPLIPFCVTFFRVEIFFRNETLPELAGNIIVILYD